MAETLERARARVARPGVREWLEGLNPEHTSASALCARVALGGIMFAHGLQKLGFFGGQGWTATIDSMESMGIPGFFAGVAILVEAVGGACLILGFLARPAALLVAVEMVVAALLVHVKNGFFLNFDMKPGVGHGFEFNLALIGLACVVLLEGAGQLALDTSLARALGAPRSGET